MCFGLCLKLTSWGYANVTLGRLSKIYEKLDKLKIIYKQIHYILVGNATKFIELSGSFPCILTSLSIEVLKRRRNNSEKQSCFGN